MPFVVTSGDPLHFPPVTTVSSLLAEPEDQAKEHRIAQAMFKDQDCVCELRSTMRFQGDSVLTRILAKIRTPGEDRSSLRLTDEDCQLLQTPMFDMRLPERHRSLVHVSFLVGTRMHGAMEQVHGDGQGYATDIISVRSQGLHLQCGQSRRPGGAGPAAQNSQHEYNGTLAGGASRVSRDACPLHSHCLPEAGPG